MQIESLMVQANFSESNKTKRNEKTKYSVHCNVARKNRISTYAPFVTIKYFNSWCLVTSFVCTFFFLQIYKQSVLI